MRNRGRSGLPGFWTTLRLLLGVARKRAVGRRRRQRQLLRQRTGRSDTGWGGIGFLISILLTAALNLAAAYLVTGAVTAGERVAAERHGRIVVDTWFLQKARSTQELRRFYAASWPQIEAAMQVDLGREATHLAERYGGSDPTIRRRLRDAVRDQKIQDFIEPERAAPGLAKLSGTGFSAMFGSIALLWWSAMLVLQGEGLELDVQRRRHPMWEWLFSHPAPPAAVFLADMLSPIAANPVYYTAPLLPGILYGSLYGWASGVLAAFVVGMPILLASACLGKALGTAVMLRCTPRSRGALIGLMGWLGYSLMTFLIVGAFVIEKAVSMLSGPLQPLSGLPWPWLGIFLGRTGDGTFSFAIGMLRCWSIAIILIAGAVWLSLWGARQGLSGRIGRLDLSPARMKAGRIRFGKDPLYRKEMMWFTRDRSVIVQVILLPLTMAGFQLFNLRGLLAGVQSHWNTLCGAAIVIGVYFLNVIGPKSLASEGSALWITLTWPRGLESLLRAKAWLWTCISSGVVDPMLCYACIVFPADTWRIALIGIGWVVFARSMAEKAVTLATVTGPSGEPEKIPRGRSWATQLGSFTFAIGVLTRQWPLAITGIVYSMMTAAAMWQNFRARLPFLQDPWSEPLPKAPSLMHAMIAISVLVEGGAILTGVSMLFVGSDAIALTRTMVYAACAAATSIGVATFLARRHVSQTEVWLWHREGGDRPSPRRWRPLSLLVGVGLGLMLGLLGLGYLALLHRIPWAAGILDSSKAQMDAVPHLRACFFVTAVLIAPVAEEYLFRGLLYRALDREWHGWRAVAGSAAFFAIYHPFLSWLPVGILGAANALLFRKTGSLAPAILLHMVYNAVILS